MNKSSFTTYAFEIWKILLEFKKSFETAFIFLAISAQFCILSTFSLLLNENMRSVYESMDNIQQIADAELKRSITNSSG